MHGAAAVGVQTRVSSLTWHQIGDGCLCVRFLFAFAVESCPWTRSCTSSFANFSHITATPTFDQKLRELRAVPLMHSVWAARIVLTAKELKEVLRKTVDDSDKILVVEVSAGWASRRAENNLGDLFAPRGGPAVALWKPRWGE